MKKKYVIPTIVIAMTGGLVIGGLKVANSAATQSNATGTSSTVEVLKPNNPTQEPAVSEPAPSETTSTADGASPAAQSAPSIPATQQAESEKEPETPPPAPVVIVSYTKHAEGLDTFCDIVYSDGSKASVLTMRQLSNQYGQPIGSYVYNLSLCNDSMIGSVKP